MQQSLLRRRAEHIAEILAGVDDFEVLVDDNGWEEVHSEGVVVIALFDECQQDMRTGAATDIGSDTLARGQAREAREVFIRCSSHRHMDRSCHHGDRRRCGEHAIRRHYREHGGQSICHRSGCGD